jgi:V8-like Glu-specific endopeptidase
MSKMNAHRNFGILIVTGVLASGAGLSSADTGRRPRIIRPPDDRKDYFATTTMLQGIGDSVCAQIDADSLDDNGDGTFLIFAETLATEYSPLCNGEPFADQPTAASCTATLVAADILVTAGHCLDENGVRTDLSTIYFVFDYVIKQEGTTPATFTTDQVYRASEILGLANVADTADDWAVVKLDRAVTGRTPVGVRSSDSITMGQSIVAIGFGAGLPMKFSDNSTVQAIVEFGFEADLDIIGGNSGGPIINANTGLIEGVLSADQGVDDYLQIDGCFRATACPQDPGCDDSFTLLASVMNPNFQATLQNAISSSGTDTGGGGGGGDDGTGAGGDETAANDEDSDGVMDNDDFCPDTPTGTQVDEEGCEILDGVDSIAVSPCGAAGIIPLMFMTLCLAFLRRRN